MLLYGHVIMVTSYILLLAQEEVAVRRGRVGERRGGKVELKREPLHRYGAGRLSYH